MDVERLYAQEVGSVFAFFARFGLSRSEAEDATHDTFVTAMSRAKSFDSSKAPKPWLLGIAFRVGVARLRHSSRREDSSDALTRMSDSSSDPERDASVRQAETIANRALATLPEVQRAVFVLHELQQVGMNEIAEMMGTSSATAWSRLRLARVSFNRAVEARVQKEGAR